MKDFSLVQNDEKTKTLALADDSLRRLLSTEGLDPDKCRELGGICSYACIADGGLSFWSILYCKAGLTFLEIDIALFSNIPEEKKEALYAELLMRNRKLQGPLKLCLDKGIVSLNVSFVAEYVTEEYLRNVIACSLPVAQELARDIARVTALPLFVDSVLTNEVPKH